MIYSPDAWVAVDERLFRSPQPTLESLTELKSVGVKTVYNLREEDAHLTRALCLQLHLVHVHIPVPDMGVPDRAQMKQFLHHIQRTGEIKSLVHCGAGYGRTGIFVACYRVAQGMLVETALTLTSHEFSPMSSNGKEWVREYNRDTDLTVCRG